MTVCHYPTGASKWNPIEHRLFSEISKHWSGQPLTDYETIARLIGSTRTQTGLVVNCALNTKDYPTKAPITKQQWTNSISSNIRSCLTGTTLFFPD